MNPSLREVRLYGRLGAQFGRVFHLAVQSPGEAVRALCAVIPGFRAAFLGDDGQAAYHVFIGRGAKREVIGESRKNDLVDASQPIRFVPAVAGSKRAGLGQSILGAVLWVAGAALELWGAFGGGGPWAVTAGDWMRTVGTAMMIGGVVQMLSPQRRQQDSATQNTPSYGMDAGAVNPPEAGSPVPIAYGRVICGSVQVSAGLSTDELGSTTSPVSGGGTSGAGGAGAGYGGSNFTTSLTPAELPGYMEPFPVDAGAGRAWNYFSSAAH